MSDMHSHLNILLLDDEPLARMVARKALEGVGHFVTEASSCAEARDLWRSNPFNLVILDHRLEDGLGIHVLEALRKEGHMEPVLYLSAETEDVCDRKEALGIEGVLSKPLDMDALKDMVVRIARTISVAMEDASLAPGPVYVGRFRLESAGDDSLTICLSDLNTLCETENWVALDMTGVTKLDDHSIVQCIHLSDQCRDMGGRFALVNLCDSLKSCLQSDTGRYVVDVFDSMDALQAAGRRLSSNSERLSVLDSVIRRDEVSKGNGKTKRSLLRKLIVPLFLIVWVGIIVGVSYSLKPKMVKFWESYNKRESLHYGSHMLRGQAAMRIMMYDDAIAYFKQALELARTPDERFAAGLAVGNGYLALAKKKPDPYSMIAEQYFEAIIDEDSNQDRLEQAYIGVLEAGSLDKDMSMVNTASKGALSFLTDMKTRAEFITKQMDVALEVGGWKDIELVLKELEPFLEDEDWRQQFAYRVALINEQLLLRDDWFREYAEQFPERDPEQLRRELLKKTISNFQQLADSGDSQIRDDCMFRIAKLLCYEGQFNEAQHYVQIFLNNEPTIHLDETLLLLSRMARIEGETEKAENLISLFIKRYRLSTQAIKEFMAVIRQLEEEDRYSDALKLVQQYLKLATGQPMLPELLAKAAELANRIGNMRLDRFILRIFLKRILKATCWPMP